MAWPKFTVKKLYPNINTAIYVMREILRRTGITMALDLNEEIQMREMNLHMEGREDEFRRYDTERTRVYYGEVIPERPTNDYDLYLYKLVMRRYMMLDEGINYVDEEIKKEMQMEEKEMQIEWEMQTWMGVTRHPIRYVKDLFNNEKRSNLVQW